MATSAVVAFTSVDDLETAVVKSTDFLVPTATGCGGCPCHLLDRGVEPVAPGRGGQHALAGGSRRSTGSPAISAAGARLCGAEPTRLILASPDGTDGDEPWFPARGGPGPKEDCHDHNHCRVGVVSGSGRALRAGGGRRVPRRLHRQHPHRLHDRSTHLRRLVPRQPVDATQGAGSGGRFTLPHHARRRSRRFGRINAERESRSGHRTNPDNATAHPAT